jgi:ABC-type multidrug transport system ATPase subunit
MSDLAIETAQLTKRFKRVLGFDPLREDVAMKRVVTYVPERVQMYDWMTVREIV